MRRVSVNHSSSKAAREPASDPDNPLILTLTLDPVSQGFFDRERQRWFPPALNMIPAHVTLFHHLPGGELEQVNADLGRLCAVQTPSAIITDGVRFLGRGSAYSLHAPAVTAFRAQLATLWQAALTAQDRQAWRPHVTVQNKADPKQARALHTRLTRDFSPVEGTATGVTLWHYLGGPWEQAARYPFGTGAT